MPGDYHLAFHVSNLLHSLCFSPSLARKNLDTGLIAVARYRLGICAGGYTVRQLLSMHRVVSRMETVRLVVLCVFSTAQRNPLTGWF